MNIVSRNLNPERIKFSRHSSIKIKIEQNSRYSRQREVVVNCSLVNFVNEKG